MDTQAKGVGGGIVAPNEARRKLNLPTVKGGATPYLQQQNFSLAALDARDQANPAPASLQQEEARTRERVQIALTTNQTAIQPKQSQPKGVMPSAGPRSDLEDGIGVITNVGASSQRTQDGICFGSNASTEYDSTRPL